MLPKVPHHVQNVVPVTLQKLVPHRVQSARKIPIRQPVPKRALPAPKAMSLAKALPSARFSHVHPPIHICIMAHVMPRAHRKPITSITALAFQHVLQLLPTAMVDYVSRPARISSMAQIAWRLARITSMVKNA